MYRLIRHTGIYFAVMAVMGLVVINSVSAITGQQVKQDTFGLWPEGTYNSSIPTIESVTGIPAGTGPVHHDQVIDYLRILAGKSEEVLFRQYGETYEDRSLCYVVISSKENIANLESVRENIGKLYDPRTLGKTEDVNALIDKTPAIAWMVYSIHGDELSSTDAALALAYQLAAGTDKLTQHLKSNLVICIDPLQNPDGRTRFLRQIEQWSGAVDNPDIQSMEHEGYWPWGRGNHYLYDLNRDWILLVNRESRAKIPAIAEWHPQMIVDSHEMGSMSTYLFSPPREPVNRNIPDSISRWRDVFGKEQAKAFDRFGWSYYRGDWHEEWYPGYGSAWGNFLGAIGILYEQAGVQGSLVKRMDNTILTFHETVHHQFISSMSNLKTLADNRVDILKDYYKDKKQWVSQKKYSSLIIEHGANVSRVNLFINNLLLQGIEVYHTTASFKTGKLQDIWGSSTGEKKFDAGTFIVPLNQPLQPLIKAMCEFDPRLSDEFLKEERRELERKRDTRLYEVSAWALPIAYDIPAYWSDNPLEIPMEQITSAKQTGYMVMNTDPQYGYIFPTVDDKAMHALAWFLKEGYNVRAAEKPFRFRSQEFPQGTVLLRRKDNPEHLKRFVEIVAQRTGTTIYGTNTAVTEVGPDLGSDYFRPLTEPRIAVVTGPPVNFSQFGTVWHLLDREFGIRSSNIDCNYLVTADLSKYNVLVIPSSWHDPMFFQHVLGPGGIEKIRHWMNQGGTVIAIGNAAMFAAHMDVGLSSAVLKRQALDKLGEYERAFKREKESHDPEFNLADVWAPQPEKQIKSKSDSSSNSGSEKSGEDILREKDELAQLYMPRGPILRGLVNREHWLCFGMNDNVPFLFYNSYALMAKYPVETPVRFAEEHNLRVSGLLWPEARERWANTAYLTRESAGKGQIILFAGPPDFRSCFHGTRRLFLNAMFFGPGFGTRQPIPW